jgi:CRISPR-associated protein Cmr2
MTPCENNMPQPPPADFWKRKLSAYLHDPPEKALDIAWHKSRAEAHQAGHDIEDAVFARDADHTAAAADRLPWPIYPHLECRFDGQLNHFKHPLGKATLKIEPFPTTDLATDSAWKSRPKLDRVADGADFDRAQFFAYWRLWRWWASDVHAPQDPRMAFLPADTRLPDHTIWAHNSLVSALQGCVVDGKCQPAFLLFNIGPVQDFIAAARRTLDLWSGSYLLSYLTASALKHIALTRGPDQVVFPNLCGQPIFDLLLREAIWDHSFIGEDPVWDSLGYGNGYPQRRLLTPSLPNRFLALVPAPSAADIARETSKVVRATFRDIAEAVWKVAQEKLAPLHPLSGQKDRFFAQIDRHLEISWQVVAWPKTPDEARKRAAVLPSSVEHMPLEGLDTVLELAAKMPKDHRDVRNFECETFPDGPKKGWKDKSKLKDDAKLDNPGAAWSALYALLNWQLDGVRANRAWQAWCKADESAGLMNTKDSLTGKEEAVLHLASDEVSDELVLQLSKAIGPAKLFKKGEVLGAVTLMKRLWPFAWLKPKHHFQENLFCVPDTRLIAKGRPFDDPDQESKDREDGPAYFAVLAFDGDEMGQWISGSHPNMPKLREVLADYHENGQRKGAVSYFEENENPELKKLLDRKRPLNPSFHLQFSEMLGTFSNVCARRIVEAFDGCLIYSGGDDVLAMLPAGNALACAKALRAAFRGTKDLNDVKGGWEVDAERDHREPNRDLSIFNISQEGFIQLHKDNHLVMAGEPKNFSAIVPGPAADCSVGIAIDHFKSPLQDVVRAAQAAEKRAKKQLGRAAVAISLFKRSGEITEWGTKWENGGLELYQKIAELLESGKLSAKFPHRVCQLLEPYRINATRLMQDSKTMQDATDFKANEAIRREFAFAISRQSASGQANTNEAELMPLLDFYLEKLGSDPQALLTAVTGFCTTVAFTHRTAADSETNPEPKGQTRP